MQLRTMWYAADLRNLSACSPQSRPSLNPGRRQFSAKSRRWLTMGNLILISELVPQLWPDYFHSESIINHPIVSSSRFTSVSMCDVTTYS